MVRNSRPTRSKRSSVRPRPITIGQGRKSIKTVDLNKRSERKPNNFKWYLSRSSITTNKREANRIANKLKTNKRFKFVKVVKRNFLADKQTKTPVIKGYWIKVIK